MCLARLLNVLCHRRLKFISDLNMDSRFVLHHLVNEFQKGSGLMLDKLARSSMRIKHYYEVNYRLGCRLNYGDTDYRIDAQS